ncbi:MAG: ECF-type sigma factor [Myxococcota bacterium]
MPEPAPLNEAIYAQLHEMATRIYARHGFGHATLQPTVLIHEAWLKLARSSSKYKSQAHFMATAARAMRQLLVDRARHIGALKRGGDLQRVTLSGLPGNPDVVLDAMNVDRALDALQSINVRASEVALMRIFGGMTHEDIAEVLDVSTRTVERNWRFAAVYLADYLVG